MEDTALENSFLMFPQERKQVDRFNEGILRTYHINSVHSKVFGGTLYRPMTTNYLHFYRVPNALSLRSTSLYHFRSGRPLTHLSS